jgi:hypothetical protein
MDLLKLLLLKLLLLKLLLLLLAAWFRDRAMDMAMAMGDVDDRD